MPSAPDRQRWGPHAETPAVRTIRAMFAADRLPHALLISGPSGVGKRDLALRIVQRSLCEAADIDRPCRECRTCRRLHDPLNPEQPPQHADVELVSPGSLSANPDQDNRNTRTIGIGVIRRVEHATTLAPFEADRRLLIIDPADAMTSEAADAFLKTLEEPPPRVHFILLTSREEQLSETIRSRCRRLTLNPLPDAQLEAWMDSVDLVAPTPDDHDRRRELRRLARGRPSWLQHALQAGDPVTVRSAQIEEAERLAGASRAERFQWTERTVGRGLTPQALADLDQILDAWSDWWRDLWLWTQNRGEAIVHVSQRDRLSRTAPMYDQQDITHFLEQIEHTRTMIHRGVNARLALDVLLLRIPPSRTSP